MNKFIEPAYRGAPAKHWQLLFGKYKGKTLSTVPGWYLAYLLRQPKLDPAFRRAIFETTQQSSDRKYAVDVEVLKHAMRVTGSTPSKKGRKERTNA
jgi:hypothetical protein